MAVVIPLMAQPRPKRRAMRSLFLLVFAAATLSYAHKAQPSQQEINAKLDQMQKTLDQIAAILKEAAAPDPPPPPVKVDVQGAQIMGDKDALVTIVEFTDMQCPYCNQFHTKTWPELHDKYIATGKVNWVSRDLPLPMHKNAFTAAEAGRCAGEQGHFWEMRDWMQSNSEHLEGVDLFAHVSSLDNIDLEQYQKCMETGKYKSSIDADVQEAQKAGISGTPGFVIGKSGPIIEGQVITGAQPLAAFEKAILALDVK